MKYDVFISYRREGGYDTAKHLYDLLTRDGYKVSFDIDTLRSGDFDTQLLLRIDQCKDFILIVNANAFDRTLDPNFDPKKDWLRQELAYALQKEKNIIPVFLSGVSGFPEGLPDDIAGVAKKNGPEYSRYYFNDFYERLKKDFLHRRSAKAKWIALSCAFIGMLCLGFLFFQHAETQQQASENGPEESVVSDNESRHEYVDMGLSVMWATKNVGASSPEDIGNYYSWGSLTPFTTLSSGEQECHLMYNVISGSSSTDVAMHEWGNNWRIPTKKECEELLEKCDWIWTTINGVGGYKVVGPNNNWIFLPATGIVGEDLNDISLEGMYGGYWAGATDEDDMAELLSFGGGGGFIFGSGMHEIGFDKRSTGHSIRPVTDKL